MFCPLMQVSHTHTFMSTSQWLGHLLHYFINAKKNKNKGRQTCCPFKANFSHSKIYSWFTTNSLNIYCTVSNNYKQKKGTETHYMLPHNASLSWKGHLKVTHRELAGGVGRGDMHWRGPVACRG